MATAQTLYQYNIDAKTATAIEGKKVVTTQQESQVSEGGRKRRREYDEIDVPRVKSPMRGSKSVRKRNINKKSNMQSAQSDDGRRVEDGDEPTGEEDDDSDAPLVSEETKRFLRHRIPWPKTGICRRLVHLSHVLSLSNALMFPHLCARYGGVAFLIAYIIAYFFVGIPVLCAEMALGQFSSMPPVELFRKMSPSLSGIGVVMLAVLSIKFITSRASPRKHSSPQSTPSPRELRYWCPPHLDYMSAHVFKPIYHNSEWGFPMWTTPVLAFVWTFTAFLSWIGVRRLGNAFVALKVVIFLGFVGNLFLSLAKDSLLSPSSLSRIRKLTTIIVILILMFAPITAKPINQTHGADKHPKSFNPYNQCPYYLSQCRHTANNVEDFYFVTPASIKISNIEQHLVKLEEKLQAKLDSVTNLVVGVFVAIVTIVVGSFMAIVPIILTRWTAPP